MKKKYLSIDIGGTQIKYGLFDRSGNLIEHNHIATPTRGQDFLKAISKLVAQHLDTIRGVAFSVPGRVHPDTSVIDFGGALPYLDGLNLKQVLTKQFGDELLVSVENDGKSAALAELWMGNLLNEKDAAAIVLGTGVGGGIILDGKLFRGVHYQAGELSFMSAKNGSEKYGTYGSAVLMIQKIARHFHFSDLNDGTTVFELINRHEPYAYQIFTEYCQRIACLILSIQSVIDLRKYVIGGGISAQPIVADTIREQFYQLLHHLKLDNNGVTPPAIVRAHFGNDANLYGALYCLLSSQVKLKEELTYV